MTQQALAPRNGGELTVDDIYPDPDNFIPPGMENVTPDELRIPILRLVQAQSKIDDKAGHEGEWHNNVTGEFAERPELLIIGVNKGRIMFPETYDATNKALCASDDGRAPRPDFIGTEIETVLVDVNTKKKSVRTDRIPAKCEGCLFGQWGENSEPPACSEVAVFAGVGEDGLPVLMQIKSSGMKAVGGLKTLIVANGIRKSIRAGSAHKMDDKGDYYVPVFTIGGKPSAEWQQTALRLAKAGNLAARNQAAAMDVDNAPQQSTDQGGAEDPGFEPAGDSADEYPF